jgi:hypothetical protein
MGVAIAVGGVSPIVPLPPFPLSVQCCSKHSCRSLPLKLSMYAFSIGFPGRIKSSFTPFRCAHSSTTRQVNSVPLSVVMTCGSPWVLATFSSIATTRVPGIDDPTSMAGLTRLT